MQQIQTIMKFIAVDGRLAAAQTNHEGGRGHNNMILTQHQLGRTDTFMFVSPNCTGGRQENKSADTLLQVFQYQYIIVVSDSFMSLSVLYKCRYLPTYFVSIYNVHCRIKHIWLMFCMPSNATLHVVTRCFSHLK